jgi:hypothetical protein
LQTHRKTCDHNTTRGSEKLWIADFSKVKPTERGRQGPGKFLSAKAICTKNNLKIKKKKRKKHFPALPSPLPSFPPRPPLPTLTPSNPPLWKKEKKEKKGRVKAACGSFLYLMRVRGSAREPAREHARPFSGRFVACERCALNLKALRAYPPFFKLFLPAVLNKVFFTASGKVLRLRFLRRMNPPKGRLTFLFDGDNFPEQHRNEFGNGLERLGIFPCLP